MRKRLLVFCDGTWESALYQADPQQLTNVARLANSCESYDTRAEPPVIQLKLYIPGIGTGEELALGAVKGARGVGLLDKVRTAYHFLAQNWCPGDEIFLVGFSRGAYTARLVSTLISQIGILSPHINLHLLPDLMRLLCSHRDGQSSSAKRNSAELAQLRRSLEPYQREQAALSKRNFLVTAMVLFDAIPTATQPCRSPLGTDDTLLEAHTCGLVVQALSSYENRPAFPPLLLRQDPAGHEDGQVLRQVWFPGDHTDIGGGYRQHDLSDLTLHFAVGILHDMLAFNLHYVAKVSDSPQTTWGSATAHVGAHLTKHARLLPTPALCAQAPTFETFHPSLLEQAETAWPRSLAWLRDVGNRTTDPSSSRIWWKLSAWEQRVLQGWQVSQLSQPDHHLFPGLTAIVKYEWEKIAGAGDSFSLSRSR